MEGSSVLEVSTRSYTGKKASRKLIRQEKIPAVYYKGEENIALEVGINVFQKFMNSGHSIITLKIDGKEEKQAILKKVQFHPVKSMPMHIDFMGITVGERIKTEVSLVMVGEAPGLKLGGFMEHKLRSLEIECLPKDLPENIEVDISSLGLGEAVHVKDLSLENIKVLTDPEELICILEAPKVKGADIEVGGEMEEEGSEEPEVIKQKDSEE